MNPRRPILRGLHLAAASAEGAVDFARRQARRAAGGHAPGHIAAYQGHADCRDVHVHGRVLAKPPAGGPLDRDGTWRNLVNTIRRWESDEVPGASVTLRFHGEERTVVADDEGYYRATFPAPEPEHDRLVWLEAFATARGAGGEAEGVHDVLVPPSQAEFAVVSDLDDTVIHTGISSLLLAAKLTFLENARTRKPLRGVPALYSALQSGRAGRPVNPIFYVSSAPWNLHDLLVDFLRLNDIPPGPLFLRDLGLDRTKFIKSRGHGHKLDKALDLVDGHPDLPFVLIGDSGQEDPAIYAELAELRPGRVRAIYIRDADPEHETARDGFARDAARRASAAGVPMILARDSLMMAEHASRAGLIPPAAITAVIEEAEADLSRPDAADQALQDAADALVDDDLPAGGSP